jgi:hypothetical protein
MEPTRKLVDDLYRDRVLRARQLPPEEKLLAGAQLYEDVCERVRAGIRSEFPDAREDRVQQILIERVNRLRLVEECGIYRSVEDGRE